MNDFDIAQFVSQLVIYMVVWIFAVSLHEAAHAWVSYKFGDDTAYQLGRVTVNPIPHIDPIGTLVLPILGFVLSYTSAFNFPLIAWGKPTPVNPLKWRNKDTANVMVSIAGIVVNLIIATVSAVIIKILIASQVITPDNFQVGLVSVLFNFLYTMVLMNVGLAIFNLLPFPPLDGSKVLQTFLPRSFEPLFEILETYGFLILLVLLQLGIIRMIVVPLNNLVLSLLF
ncbi:MAG TPA: site-2 protease family protein [Pyrinomonadaceae bacterium]|jgi:Zn-dependent protease